MLNLSFKQLFLLDSLGAFLTALLLSQVLARFESSFGMPREILFVLAGIAACFALYSLLCHFFLKKKWQPYLKAIAIANTIYCLVTLGLVIYFFRSLTWLGILYFFGEIIVVVSLARIEIQKSRHPL